MNGLLKALENGEELEKDEYKTVLKAYLMDNLDSEDLELGVKEIIEKYKVEIDDIHSTKEWWIFNNVSAQLNYDILMAEASEIGFKRTIRGVKERSNDLFNAENGKIKINSSEPEKIIDFLRAGESEELI